MEIDYTTNSWPDGHGYYVLLGSFGDDDIPDSNGKADSYYVTVEEIEFLNSIGYDMRFMPCF